MSEQADIAKLNIIVDSTQTKKAKSDLDDLASAGGKASGSLGVLSTTAQKLGKIFTGLVVAAKLLELLQVMIKITAQSVLMNARFETLGVVMNTVGKNAGYTASQMAIFEKGLNRSGIAMIHTREVLTRMAQAQIDLTQAQTLSRIAQDAAVIGNINSSEALKRMIYGIQTAQIEVLRNIGINVNFEQTYKRIAKELGKTADALTVQEKLQARVNTVMETGITINGTYLASMQTASKQLKSMERYVDDLKVRFGEIFTPAFTAGVWLAVEAFQKMLETMKELKSDGSIEFWANELLNAFSRISDAIFYIYKTFELVQKIGNVVFNTLILGSWNLAAAIFAAPIKAVEYLLELWNKIPGMNIELPSGITGFADRIIEETNLASQQLKEASDALISFFTDFKTPSQRIAEQLDLQRRLALAIDDTYDADFGHFTDSLNDVVELTKEQLAAIKEHEKVVADFYDKYAKATLSQFEYEKQQLDIALVRFGIHIKDKVKLAEWYDAELKKLEDEKAERETKATEKALEDFFKEIDTKEKAEQKSYDKRTKAEKDYQEEQQKLREDAYKDFSDTIQENTADILRDWDNAWETMTDIMKDALIEMAAEALTSKVIVPIAMQIGSSMGLSWNGVPMSSMTGATSSTSGFGLPGSTALNWSQANIPGMGWLGSTIPGTSSPMMSGPGAGQGMMAGTTWGSALGYGAMGGMGYSMIGGSLGLPQNEWSALTAGIGGAIGSIIPGLGNIIGTALGSVVGGLVSDLFGDDPDPKIKMGSSISSYMGSDEYGYKINPDDMGNQDAVAEPVIAYFDAYFKAIDDQVSISLKDVLNNAEYRADGNMSDYDDDINAMLSAMTDNVFEDISGSLVQAMGLSAETFNLDFFEGIQAEGQDLFSTFVGFSALADSFTDFGTRVDEQLNTGISLETAYGNLQTISGMLDLATTSVESMASSSTITALETVVSTYDAYIQAMEDAAATQGELAQIQIAMAQEIGSAITGLNADSVQSGIISAATGGSSLTDAMTATINNSLAQTIAGAASQNIMDGYISGLNQQVGEAVNASMTNGSLDAGTLSDLVTNIMSGFDWEGMESSVSAAVNSVNALIGAEEEEADYRQLNIQLMELQGDAAGALALSRELELEGMDETAQAIQEKINALKDQATEEEKQLGYDKLNIKLLEAQGLSAEALVESRRLEALTMDETTLAIQERIWALEDQSAIDEEEEALRITNSNLNIKLLELQGNSIEALSLSRELEIEGIDTTTAAIYEQIWAYEDQAAAAEDASEALEKEIALEKTNANLTIELLELQGDAAGSLALSRQLETSEMDETTRAIQEQIYVLQDEKTAREEATAIAEEAAAKEAEIAESQAQLNIQLMELQGDSAGALALSRELELAAMDESLISTQLMIYALEDAATAAQEAADALAESEAIALSYSHLQVELMKLEGDVAGALALSRQLELDTMDESLHPIQERIWALEDEAKAADEAAQAAEDLAASMENIFKSEKGFVASIDKLFGGGNENWGNFIDRTAPWGEGGTTKIYDVNSSLLNPQMLDVLKPVEKVITPEQITWTMPDAGTINLQGSDVFDISKSVASGVDELYWDYYGAYQDSLQDTISQMPQPSFQEKMNNYKSGGSIEDLYGLENGLMSSAEFSDQYAMKQVVTPAVTAPSFDPSVEQTAIEGAYTLTEIMNEFAQDFDPSTAQSNLENLNKVLSDLADSGQITSEYYATLMNEAIARYSAIEQSMNTVTIGIDSFNKALDENYVSSGKMVLLLNGMAADDYPVLTNAIDTLNAAIESTEDGTYDFSASLISFGSIFDDLNEQFTTGAISADQYQSILATGIELYTESIQQIKYQKSNWESFSESISGWLNKLEPAELNPEEQYRATSKLFKETYDKALAGDLDAQAELTGVADQFLDASRSYQVNQADYMADYVRTKAAMTDARDIAVEQVDSLDELLSVAVDQVVSIEELTDITTKNLSNLYDINNTINDTIDELPDNDDFSGLFGDYLGGDSPLASLLKSLELAISSLDLSVTITGSGNSTIPVGGGSSIPGGAHGGTVPLPDKEIAIPNAPVIDTTPVVDTSQYTIADAAEAWFVNPSAATITNAMTQLGFTNTVDLMHAITDPLSSSNAAAAKAYYGFAEGGVSDGPQSGYPALLHGKEAIIPLGSGDLTLNIPLIRDLLEEIKELRREIITISKDNAKSNYDTAYYTERTYMEAKSA